MCDLGTEMVDPLSEEKVEAGNVMAIGNSRRQAQSRELVQGSPSTCSIFVERFVTHHDLLFIGHPSPLDPPCGLRVRTILQPVTPLFIGWQETKNINVLEGWAKRCKVTGVLWLNDGGLNLTIFKLLSALTKYSVLIGILVPRRSPTRLVSLSSRSRLAFTFVVLSLAISQRRLFFVAEGCLGTARVG